LLSQFEENDKQLEVIAGRIVQALSKVKMTAQEMNTAIKKQGQMLKATNKRADKGKLELTK
jgi:hypothetical protein